MAQTNWPQTPKELSGMLEHVANVLDNGFDCPDAEQEDEIYDIACELQQLSERLSEIVGTI
jgi:hypothetical protein|tara:strand:+ start:601 stop:783 length:183 start_codon:yes stop_codon:yes gene_type:complete